MNLLRFEIKFQMRKALTWALISAVLVIIFMNIIYPFFLGSYDAVKKVLDGFPKEFADAFGLEIALLFSYEGFYSFACFYLFVFGAIISASITISIFAREKMSKCLDFLLTRPMRRKRIFACKLLASVAVLTVTNLLFVGVSVTLYSLSKGTDKRFLLAASSLFFTQLLFLSFGVFVSVFFKRIRSVSGTASAIGFGAFVLSALSSIIEERFPEHFYAPLKYFDPSNLFFKGSYEMKYVLTAMIIFIVCLFASYLKFTKGDAQAV